MTETNNTEFRTGDLTQAAFYYCSGVLFDKVDYPDPNRPADYVFHKVPDAVQIAWQKGDDRVSAKAMHEAIRYLTKRRYDAEKAREENNRKRYLRI